MKKLLFTLFMCFAAIPQSSAIDSFDDFYNSGQSESTYSDTQSYTIGFGDRLQIEVYDEDDDTLLTGYNYIITLSHLLFYQDDGDRVFFETLEFGDDYEIDIDD